MARQAVAATLARWRCQEKAEALASQLQAALEANLELEQQASEVDMLHRQAEETAENLVRGNQYLDSAAKHSRDFRLLVLAFLITASFALLFLDWYYD